MQFKKSSLVVCLLAVSGLLLIMCPLRMLRMEKERCS